MVIKTGIPIPISIGSTRTYRSYSSARRRDAQQLDEVMVVSKPPFVEAVIDKIVVNVSK